MEPTANCSINGLNATTAFPNTTQPNSVKERVAKTWAEANESGEEDSESLILYSSDPEMNKSMRERFKEKYNERKSSNKAEIFLF